VTRAEKTWKVLEDAINEIHNQNASGLSFEELYRWAHRPRRAKPPAGLLAVHALQPLCSLQRSCKDTTPARAASQERVQHGAPQAR
jgi:hypothetical protein